MNLHHPKPLTAMLLLAIICNSCQPSASDNSAQKSNVAETQVANATEWTVLFDGTTLAGWRGYNMDSLPPNWIQEGNTLKSLGKGGDLGGDVVYGIDQYENFELVFEWKISEGGNSGVFYHVAEDQQYKAPYETGPEYQVIDDIGFPEPLEEWQSVGADYAMHVAEEGTKRVKPAGEWNTSKILFTPEKAAHWLNGVQLFEFVPYSEDWEKRRASGKWDSYPDYAKYKTGYIGIQDHGSYTWYRNIKIRKL